MVDDREQMYRAIGRFIVEFSQLVNVAEGAIAFVIANGRPTSLAYAAMGERTAAPIVDSYFALCAEIGNRHWSPADKKAVRALKNEVDDLVRYRRNRYAHDVWLVGWTSHRQGAEPEPAPHELHRIVHAGEGVRWKRKEMTAAQLEARADDADRLRAILSNLLSNVALRATDLDHPSPCELLDVDDCHVRWRSWPPDRYPHVDDGGTDNTQAG